MNVSEVVQNCRVLGQYYRKKFNCCNVLISNKHWGIMAKIGNDLRVHEMCLVWSRFRLVAIGAS